MRSIFQRAVAFVVPAVILTSAAIPAFAGGNGKGSDATPANDARPAAASSAEAGTEFSVKVKDCRDWKPRLLETKAAGLSRNNGVIVIYFGDNQEQLNEVRAGASAAKDGRNVPVGGVIQGRDPEHDGTVLIYADGDRKATIKVSSKTRNDVEVEADFAHQQATTVRSSRASLER